MSDIQSGGVRLFSDTTLDRLEETINTFLKGDGSTDIPRKRVTHAPQFTVDAGTFYVLVSYETAGL